MKKILEVKDLCKTYVVNKRQNNVLRNVNFTIADGEMVAVMDHPVLVSQRCYILFLVWTILLQGKYLSVEKILHCFPKRSLPGCALMKWDLSFSKCIC